MVFCYESHDIELLKTVIDRGLDMIQQNPNHLEHVLLECCVQRDINAFIFIFRRAKAKTYARAFGFWCKAGDLKAVSVLFEDYRSKLMASIPQAFVFACRWGDMELAQLLNQFADGSILESTYHDALLAVSYRGLTDLILMLSEFCPYLQLDVDKLILAISPETINLLNELFGATLDPKNGVTPMPTYGPKGYPVKYGNREMLYNLDWEQTRRTNEYDF